MSSLIDNWEWLHGRDIAYKQVIRRNQQLIKKAIKSIDKEKSKLEKESKKQTEQFNRNEQKNELDVIRYWTTDLDRLKGQVNKLLKMKQQLQSVSTNLLIMKTQLKASEAVYQVLQKLNRNLNMPQMQAILKEFEKHAAQVMKNEKGVIEEPVDEGESEPASELAEDCIQLSLVPSTNIHGVIQAVPKPQVEAVIEPEAGSSSMGDEQMGIKEEINELTQSHRVPVPKKDAIKHARSEDNAGDRSLNEEVIEKIDGFFH